MSVFHAACSWFDLEGTCSAFEPVKTLVGDKCKLFKLSKLQLWAGATPQAVLCMMRHEEHYHIDVQTGKGKQLCQI